jgi:hypothetical protein
MGGRNPRPCVCGHVRTGHWPWFQMPCTECHECYRYRPAPRTEPLRARRDPWAKALRAIDDGEDLGAIIRQLRQGLAEDAAYLG